MVNNLVNLFNDILEVFALGVCYYAFLILCIHFRLQYRCVIRTLVMTIITVFITFFAAIIDANLPVCIIIIAYLFQEAVSNLLMEWKFTQWSSQCIFLRKIVLAISYMIVIFCAIFLDMCVPLSMIVCACTLKGCSELWIHTDAIRMV